MKNFSLVNQLEAFFSPIQEEQQFCNKMLELIHNEKRCFYRDCFPAHFTGSALLIDPETGLVLLNHHRILNKWLQFGGHCDGNENILEVAYREAMEESGISSLTIFSHTPIDLDIHAIPTHSKRQEPAHFHYDVRFIFLTSRNNKFLLSQESHELRWFSWSEIDQLSLDKNLTRYLNKSRQALAI